MDPDTYDRSMQPIYVQDDSNMKINNKLNSFMDHIWDGFYTGQVRLSRFNSLVEIKKG